MNPQNHDQMAVTSASGVYTSPDGGKNWTRMAGLPDCVSALNKSNAIDSSQCAALVGQQQGHATDHDGTIPEANKSQCRPDTQVIPPAALKDTSMGAVDSNLYRQLPHGPFQSRRLTRGFRRRGHVLGEPFRHAMPLTPTP